MPRLTDRSRRERRDDIAQAALRVLAREGVANASIAQIVTESGRSSGAIYSHFRNKAELARYIADRMLGWRIDSIAERATDGGVHAPAEVMLWLLDPPGAEAPPVAVLLQFWAEATTNAELHAVMAAKMGDLRDVFRGAIRGWAEIRAQGGTEADALADRTASAMVVACQGWLANSGLLGWLSPEEYVAAVATAFATERSPRD